MVKALTRSNWRMWLQGYTLIDTFGYNYNKTILRLVDLTISLREYHDKIKKFKLVGYLFMVKRNTVNLPKKMKTHQGKD